VHTIPATLSGNLIFQIHQSIPKFVSSHHLPSSMASTTYTKKPLKPKIQIYKKFKIHFLLTPYSRALPEKPTGPHLVRTFPAVYGTQKFITAIQVPATSPYPKSNQSSPCSPSHVLKIRFNIILPSTSRSSERSTSLRYPHQNPVCTSPLPQT